MLTLPRSLLATAALLAAAGGLTGAGAASADLSGRISSSRGKDRALRNQIGADTRHIQGFQGRIDDLRRQLDGVQRTLSTEQAQLSSLQGQLRSARSRLTFLRLQYVRDRRILAAQLVGQYEAPHPSLVNVVLQAHGFADLLELADRFKAVSHANAQVAARVRTSRTEVGRQTARLTTLEAHQQQVTQATLVQRDAVAQVKLDLVDQQLAYVRARSRKSAQLTGLRAARRALEQRLARIQAAQSAALPASAASATGPGLPAGGAPPWSPHGGSTGFFPAAGTNYSVGDEPRIAARLDVMGRALGLHLIGLSGYRTPQHSLEVGGFANDPHTRGQASDTPGLEGVPEGTLNRYGITRPFPGPAEADHVQLVGSI